MLKFHTWRFPNYSSIVKNRSSAHRIHMIVSIGAKSITFDKVKGIKFRLLIIQNNIWKFVIQLQFRTIKFAKKHLEAIYVPREHK